MNRIFLILLIISIPLTCLIINLINRKRESQNSDSKPAIQNKIKEIKSNKKFPVIQLLILLLFVLCIASKIPNYISMQKRGWVSIKLPVIFSETWKKYSPTTQELDLRYSYRRELKDQFYRLDNINGFDNPKMRIVPILSYVLKNELEGKSKYVDTFVLFDKLKHLINDTVLAYNTDQVAKSILEENLNTFKQKKYTELEKYRDEKGKKRIDIIGKNHEKYVLSVISNPAIEESYKLEVQLRVIQIHENDYSNIDNNEEATPYYNWFIITPKDSIIE